VARVRLQLHGHGTALHCIEPLRSTCLEARGLLQPLGAFAVLLLRTCLLKAPAQQQTRAKSSLWWEPSGMAEESEEVPPAHKKCVDMVEESVTSCPKVKTLQEALRALGKEVPITCIRCPGPEEGKPAAAGGFMTDSESIVLCQDWMAQQPLEVNNTLTHELVHAYDHARSHLDWTNLTHHACTEIRAALLSGDCTLEREFSRGNFNPFRLSRTGERCVRRRAQLSVAMNPACPDSSIAEAAVSRAWSVCAKDFAPFDEIPPGY